MFSRGRFTGLLAALQRKSGRVSRAAKPFILTLDSRGRFLLLRDPVPEEYHQLRVDDAPVLAPACPLCGDIHHRQIQHLKQTVIGRKYRFGFRDLAKLPVEAFNGVGGINQPPDLLWELEVCAEIRPILPP